MNDILVFNGFTYSSIACVGTLYGGVQDGKQNLYTHTIQIGHVEMVRIPYSKGSHKYVYEGERNSNNELKFIYKGKV